jgi:hypothetical protein
MSTQHWGTFVMVYQSTFVCGVGDDFVLIYPLVIKHGLLENPPFIDYFPIKIPF